MSSLFRATDVNISEAVRKLRGNDWFQIILKQMERQADVDGQSVAYPKRDGAMPLEWHAGRLSLAMEFIECFTRTPTGET